METDIADTRKFFDLLVGRTIKGGEVMEGEMRLLLEGGRHLVVRGEFTTLVVEADSLH